MLGSGVGVEGGGGGGGEVATGALGWEASVGVAESPMLELMINSRFRTRTAAITDRTVACSAKFL